MSPVISTLLLIFIATILISVLSTPQKDFTSSINNKFNEQQHSIIISNEQNEQIRNIREQGFVLAIPKSAPKPNIELENIIHRNNEDNNYVYTQFSSNDNELFSILQEAINNKRQAERTIENYTEQLEIQGLTVYFKESEVQHKIFLMTDNYSVEISSHYLSKDDLVKILESVQLEKLVE
ncbi:hypothetical protein CHI07_20435 [Paenibacillus sp. 7884-2]|nr:hypothetical protein CHI07_20435 [Paenibacillus sp. 7884-2]